MQVLIRNHFREFYFRNSLTGREMPKRTLEEHIYTCMGLDPKTQSYSTGTIAWKKLITELVSDFTKNQNQLYKFLNNVKTRPDEVRWAWHGTDKQSVIGITTNHFHLSKVKRQVHGKGFYVT
eukprot:UN31166